MRRRTVLKGVGSTVSSVGFAGCSGVFGGAGDTTETSSTTAGPDISTRTFDYYFQDATGTLGQVGDDQIPGDVSDWQIITNELEERDWNEMQSNDIEYARQVMERDYDSTVNEIITRTEEILENPEQELSDYDTANDIDVQNDTLAIIYTAALIKATDETDIQSSGGMDQIIPPIAEPVREQLELEIPGFSLTSNRSTEAYEPDEDSDVSHGGVPRNIAPDDADGELIKVNSGFHHPSGLLQYENEDGELEIKYVEVTGPESLFNNRWIRDPEGSIYARPLDEGPTTGNYQRMYPHHFLTSFEYSKGRQLEEMGGLRWGGELDWAISATLYNLVDDAQDDVDVSNGQSKSYGDTPGWDIIVEDSFGEALEAFKQNPTQQKATHMENAARGMKLAFEKHGYDESLRVGGTLENPTYEHLARAEFESIIADRPQQTSS